jgi:hypothetical protein
MVRRQSPSFVNSNLHTETLAARGLIFRCDKSQMQRYLTDRHTNTLALRGLEGLFYSCAVVSVFGSGGE